MTDHPRRGVTRGYVGGLIFAVIIVAFALMLALWGGISLLGDTGPITTPDKGFSVAAVIILLCFAMLARGLWSQSIALLRGRRAVPWAHLLAVSVGGYLLWCVGGVAVGLSLEDTWISPYPATLALCWAIASLLCWAVLLRRVYTDRPPPRWPWERRGELGPDWAGTGEDPWNVDDDDSDESDRPGGGRE